MSDQSTEPVLDSHSAQAPVGRVRKRLASLLVGHLLLDRAAVEDPEGYDGGDTLRRLEQVATILCAEGDEADMPGLEDKQRALLEDLKDAEEKAWDSLARYKFMMFGYWAGIWVHLNRCGGFKAPSPWTHLVALARMCRNMDRSKEAANTY